MSRLVPILTVVLVFAASCAFGQVFEPGKWTIVNHGACGVFTVCEYEDLVHPTDGWMGRVGEHIKSLNGGQAVVHTIINDDTYEISNSSLINDSSKHHILLFDWTRTAWMALGSRDEEEQRDIVLGDGYAYAAGDALYSLIHSLGIEDDVFAYIGYSRGAIVGSEFIRRMFIDGHALDQVVYIDGEGGTVYGGEKYPDLRHTAWPAPSGSTVRWDNVFSTFTEFPVPLGGNRRPRCWNYNLGSDYSHTGMPDYIVQQMSFEDGRYVFGDVDETSPPDASLDLLDLDDYNGYGAGDYDGWEGGAYDDPWHGSDCTRIPHPNDKFLFNGDFQWNSKAGWFNHGGRFEATLESANGNHGAAIGADASTNLLQHSWFRMPENATSLAFSWGAVADEYTHNADKLSVGVERLSDSDWRPLGFYPINTNYPVHSSTSQFAIPEAYKGEVCRIQFYVDPDSDGHHDYRVFIDNVAIQRDGTPLPSVHIDTPSDDDEVSGTVTIEATADAPDSAVDRVEFSVGEHGEDPHPLSSDSSAPYTAQWNTASYTAGDYEIQAVVYNTAQMTGTHTITVTVPYVPPGYDDDYTIENITASPSAPIIGEQVNVQATLRNAGAEAQSSGKVVRFYVDGIQRGYTSNTNAMDPGETQPVYFSWTATDGAHDLEICADLYGDENESNDCASMPIVVGAQGELLVDGSGGPNRTISMVPSQSADFTFVLQNPGSAPVVGSASAGGSYGSWISFPAGSSFDVDPGETVELTFRVNTGSSEGNYPATVSFQYGSGTVVASLQIRVAEIQDGHFEWPFSDSDVTIDGRSSTTMSCSHGTGFFMDNDDSTPEEPSRTNNIDLPTGASGSLYARLMRAYWNLQAREDEERPGVQVSFHASITDGDSRDWPSSFTINDLDIMSWSHPNDNEIKIYFSPHYIGAADTKWYVYESTTYWSFATAAWMNSSAVSISQSELDAMGAGWDRGRLYFDVSNITTSGDLHLWINGRKAETADTGDDYFTIRHSQLSTNNVFNIKPDPDDQTRCTLNDIEVDIRYYSGDPSLTCTRTITPSNAAIGQNLTVSLTFVNNGSNIAEEIQYNESPLPDGLERVSGPLSGSVSDLDPGDSTTASYVIRASEPGVYALGARPVQYQDPSGHNYATTFEPAALTIGGGDLLVDLQLSASAYGIGQPIPITVFATRAVDDQVVSQASVICSVLGPDRSTASFVLPYDAGSSSFEGTFAATQLEGDYSFTATASAPFYTEGSTVAAVVATVTNDFSVPTLANVTATQLSDSSLQVSALVTSPDSEVQCRVYYGLTTAYGQVSDPVTLSATTDPVPVDVVVPDLVPGNTYHVQLVATNTGGAAHGGNMTVTLNQAPTLSWTGESSYLVDGVQPDQGEQVDLFEFRVRYSDPNDDGPALDYPRIHLYDAGVELADSPFLLVPVDAEPYTTGRIYHRQLTNLPASDQLSYRIAALDELGLAAVGVIDEIAGPIVDISYGISFVADPDMLEVPEGGSATVGITLSGPPTETIVADIVREPGGDDDIGLTTTGQFSFTASNWDVPHLLEFTAAEDGDDINGQATYVISGVSGQAIGDFPLVVSEVDAEACPLGDMGDLNCDCVVNIFDVVTVTGHFGEACGDPEMCAVDCADADVVPNCQVDIFDVVSVTGHYGLTCDLPPLAWVMPEPGATDRLELALVPRQQACAIGDSLHVDLIARGDLEAVYGYQLAVHYDHDKLRYASTRRGDVFADDSQDALWLVAPMSRSVGTTPLAGSTRLVAATGTCREAVLATVSFIVEDGTGLDSIRCVDDLCRFVDQTGCEIEATSVNADDMTTISGLALTVIGPNPMSSEIHLGIDSAREEATTLSIYDVRGRLVRSLVSANVSSGRTIVTWDGRDEAGYRVHSGVYFCRLAQGQRSETKKIIILK